MYCGTKILLTFYGTNLKNILAIQLCRIQTGGFAGEINEGEIWFNIGEKENPNFSAFIGGSLQGFTGKTMIHQIFFFFSKDLFSSNVRNMF